MLRFGSVNSPQDPIPSIQPGSERLGVGVDLPPPGRPLRGLCGGALDKAPEVECFSPSGQSDEAISSYSAALEVWQQWASRHLALRR
jgi:hypothetical protein